MESVKMRKIFLLAACSLPLAACATSPYGYGYNDPVGAVIGALGSGYYGPYGYNNGYYGNGYGGSGFTQAAANACANYAARYGAVSVRNVQMLDSSHAKVFGYVSSGYRQEGWDCTFRSDGRITDFDL
jgi:hypothetical protein